MDPGTCKTLDDPVFIDIKGLQGQERDCLISLLIVKKFRFYDSSESIQAPNVCEAHTSGNEHPEAHTSGNEHPEAHTSGNEHPEAHASGNEYPEGSGHAKVGLQNGPANPLQTNTGKAAKESTTPPTEGTKLNVEAKVFEPRGILMLQKDEDHGQASQSPKDNKWASSSKSAASLFNQSSIKSSRLTQNGHQVPCNGGMAVRQTAPTQADENRMSREKQVRSAVRGVLKETKKVEPPRAKGIKNILVSCYFNALIQSILVVEGFASFLDGVLEALNRLPFDGVAVLQDIAPVCASLIRLWMDYKAHPHNIGTVREEHTMQLIHSLDNKEFALDRQSDPLDLFMVLISNIQVELEGVKQDRRLHPQTLLQDQAESGGNAKEEEEGWQQVKTGRRAGCRQKYVDKSCPVQRSFKGRLGTLRHFEGRPAEDDDSEPFYFLALPINTQEVTSVKQALEKFFDLTVCEQTRRLEKHCFVELPETLMLSFGNTIVDHNGEMMKIRKQIDLNEVLVLSDDMLSDSLKKQLKKGKKYPRYQLVSGFYHRGQFINGGHYVAFQRNKRIGWTLLDDENVSFYPTSEQLFRSQKVETTQVPHGLLYILEFNH